MSGRALGEPLAIQHLDHSAEANHPLRPGLDLRPRADSQRPASIKLELDGSRQVRPAVARKLQEFESAVCGFVEKRFERRRQHARGDGRGVVSGQRRIQDAHPMAGARQDQRNRRAERAGARDDDVRLVTHARPCKPFAGVGSRTGPSASCPEPDERSASPGQ